MNIRRKPYEKRKKTGILLGILGVFVISGIFFFSAQDQAYGKNPMEGMLLERSKVVVTGEGFQLDPQRQEEINKEEQKREEQQKENPEEITSSPVNGEYGQKAEASAGGGEKSSLEGQEENQEERPGNHDSTGASSNGSGQEDPPEDPNGITIECTIEQGATQPGTAYQFWVKAWDKNGYEIPRSQFYVVANGEQIYSSGAAGINGTKYRMDLVAGTNTVTITVSDNEDQEKTVHYSFIGDPTATEDPKGTVYLGIDARTVSLGYLCPPQWVSFYPSDNIATLVQRQLQAYGYSYTFGGNVNSGYYLARISRPGMTQGYQVLPEIQTIHQAQGTSLGPIDSNSLGQRDFYQYSGWMYAVNRGFPNVGMVEQEIADGDYIQIIFTTEYGKEYNGEWNIPGVGFF